MDEEASVGALEVDTVVLGAVAIEVAVFAVELAEFIGVGAVEVLGEEVEFAEDLQLEHFGQVGQFGGAAVVKDDLEHSPIFNLPRG